MRTPRDIIGLTDPTSPTRDRVSVFHLEYDIFEDHISFTANRLARSKRLRKRKQTLEAVRQTIHSTAVGSIIWHTGYGVAPYANYQFRGPATHGEWSSDHMKRELARLLAGKPQNKRPLRRGDIVFLSLQQTVNDIAVVPIDWSETVARLLGKLRDAGAIVLIAAGNGGRNLSTCAPSLNFPADHEALSARRSGALRVGYTNESATQFLQSNFGDNVSFFVRAEGVRTACYDFNDETQEGDLLHAKTQGFGRSSAATPILAGLCAEIQNRRVDRRLAPLDALGMEGLLKTLSETKRINGRSVFLPRFSEDHVEQILDAA